MVTNRVYQSNGFIQVGGIDQSVSDVHDRFWYYTFQALTAPAEPSSPAALSPFPQSTHFPIWFHAVRFFVDGVFFFSPLRQMTCYQIQRRPRQNIGKWKISLANWFQVIKINGNARDSSAFLLLWSLVIVLTEWCRWTCCRCHTLTAQFGVDT